MHVPIHFNPVTTNTDFSGCAPYLMIFAVVLMLLGLVTMFVKAPFLQILYSALAVLLYGMYLVYDTQLVLGRFSTHYGFDDYYLASLSLYMDIIQLFLNIMNIMKLV